MAKAKPVKQPFRNKPLGWLLSLSGGLLVCVAIVVFAILRQNSITGNGLFDTVMWMVPGGLAGLFLTWGRKLRSVDARALLAQDERPPIVYLRSFSADSDAISTPFGIQQETEEDQLAGVFSRVGPFVAIGRPGETLPQAGAARLYVGDDEWQETVDGFLDRALLVVLRVGATDGFWWEVERVRKKLPPEKVLLYFENVMGMTTAGTTKMREERYATFRERASAVFPNLSEEDPGKFLAFGPDWEPRPLGGMTMTGIMRKGGVQAAMAEMLRPVFEALGVEQPKVIMLRMPFKIAIGFVLLLILGMIVAVVIKSALR